ncbi:MAG: adenylyltransferase/cytidyltransferase family protein, partial [Bacteroidales bacterium]|nr:adenylyltransferase/cytidyltransferase family protein [Bacteroidales bacterium]
MKIYHETKSVSVPNPVVTIGIFDGVHKGHQRIIGRIKEISENSGGETILVTFWPHPRTVLSKDIQVKLLSTYEEKINRIRLSGIDHLIILPFTTEFANTPFDEFIARYLVNDIGSKHVVIGYNHHFGKDRKGGFEQLVQSSEKYNFSVE